jgi:hypothetical protein
MDAHYWAGIIGCSGIAIACPERTTARLRSLQPHLPAAAYHAVSRTEVGAAMSCGRRWSNIRRAEVNAPI